MRARVVTAVLALTLTAGCGSSSMRPAVTVAPVDALPAGAQEVTTVPATATTLPPKGSADCGDPEASLRPGPLSAFC